EARRRQPPVLNRECLVAHIMLDRSRISAALLNSHSHSMDARIATAPTHVERQPPDTMSAARLAADVNLPTSRSAHLFRRDVARKSGECSPVRERHLYGNRARSGH